MIQLWHKNIVFMPQLLTKLCFSYAYKIRCFFFLLQELHKAKTHAKFLNLAYKTLYFYLEPEKRFKFKFIKNKFF